MGASTDASLELQALCAEDCVNHFILQTYQIPNLSTQSQWCFEPLRYETCGLLDMECI